MRNGHTRKRRDPWGNPRVAHVYPAKRAKGYYARALDDGGKRTRVKFFGQKRYGGATTAYDVACRYADPSSFSRRSGTLNIPKTVNEPRAQAIPAGPKRYRLASRYIDLRRSRTNRQQWVVVVRIGQGAERRVRHFDVATYGLALALRNAITCQLQWEEKYRGQRDQIGVNNWVRLFLYIVQMHGTEPVSLTEQEPPARITLGSRYVQCVRPGGTERRFAPSDYGGRFLAHAAAVVWAIEDVAIEGAELAV